MARDDGVLYNGMNSASFAKVKETREVNAEAKKEKASKAEKDAHVVFEMLTKKRESLRETEKDLLKVNDTPEHYKTVKLAVDLYETLLLSLEGEMRALLPNRGKK